MFTLADAYLHQLNPFVVQFTDSFGLRWYGLAYVAGFIVAWLLLQWMAKTRRSMLSPQDVSDLLVYVVLGVLLGGRLGYALFYAAGQPFITFSSDFPFWEILAIHRGGMSAHGGMIGVIVAVTIYAYRRKVSALHLLDLAGMGACPGLFFGRLANFINAELWGKPIPQDMQANPPWWSIKYVQEIMEVWLPTATNPATKDTPAGIDAAEKLRMIESSLGPVIGMTNDFFERVTHIALSKTSDMHTQVIEALRPLLTAHYPSQLIQAFTDGPVLMGALILIWLRPRKMGVAGSWFLIIYGILRTVTEVWRTPDEGVALLMGLSRGQVLSLLMTAAGFVCLTIALKRPGAPVLGLGKNRIPAAPPERAAKSVS